MNFLYEEEILEEAIDYILKKLKEEMDSELYGNMLSEVNLDIIYEKPGYTKNKDGMELALKRRTNREKFDVIINHLSKLLIDVPKITESMARNLEVPLENIMFKVDNENNENMEEPIYTKELVEKSELYKVANNNLRSLKAVLNIDKG